MQKYWFALWLIFASCVGPEVKSPYAGHVAVESRTFYLDSAWSIDDQLKIKAAVEDWNVVLNGAAKLQVSPVTVDVTPSTAAVLQIIDGTAVWQTPDSNPFIPIITGKTTLAWTHGLHSHDIWIIRDRVGADELEDVVEHEIGHILGAEHAGTCLMTADRSNCHCVDKPVAQQIANRLHVDVETFRYCK